LYKIAQASEILGVSRSAIYKKLDKYKVELKGCIRTRKGLKYITEEGLDFLKLSTELPPVDNQRDKTVDNLVETEHLKLLIIDKDKQIEQHIKEKENLMELLRNSQVLMKQEQNRILLLEHKLEEKESMIDPDEVHEQSETIWGRITGLFKSSH